MAQQQQQTKEIARITGGQLSAFLRKNQTAMQTVIPKHLTPEKLIGIAANAVNYNPRLQECTLMSVVAGVVRASQLGLSVDPFLGHAYLVPFQNSKTNKKLATLIVGYKGYIQLAMNSGKVSKVWARAVHQKDSFDYWYGVDESIEHRPFMDGDPGALTHVYAVVKRVDGATKFDVMSRQEVESIRRRSKAAEDGPWVTDYEEMAKKTVLRRLLKTEPLSPEIQQLIGEEEVRERADLDTSDVIDVGAVLEDADAEDRDLSARTEARKDALKERLANAKGNGQSQQPPPMPAGMKPVTQEDIEQAEARLREQKAKTAAEPAQQAPQQAPQQPADPPQPQASAPAETAVEGEDEESTPPAPWDPSEKPPADLPVSHAFPPVANLEAGAWLNYKGKIYRFDGEFWRPFGQAEESGTLFGSQAAPDPAQQQGFQDPGDERRGGRRKR